MCIVVNSYLLIKLFGFRSLFCFFVLLYLMIFICRYITVYLVVLAIVFTQPQAPYNSIVYLPQSAFAIPYKGCLLLLHYQGCFW